MKAKKNGINITIAHQTNGSIEQLCQLYNVVEDNPEEALRKLLRNIM